MKGANWRRPYGPKSNIRGLEDHPVVYGTFGDALAYAKWAGKDLPTEAESEFAARGGLDGKEFAWGDELTPDGKHIANIWQGYFPFGSQSEDGFELTSPVMTYPPNCYGLYDIVGMSGSGSRTGTLKDMQPRRKGLLHSGKSARWPRIGQLRSAALEHQDSAEDHQRWLASVCAELLPALSPGDTPCRTGRHFDEPCRFSPRRKNGTDRDQYGIGALVKQVSSRLHGRTTMKPASAIDRRALLSGLAALSRGSQRLWVVSLRQ